MHVFKISARGDSGQTEPVAHFGKRHPLPRVFAHEASDRLQRRLIYLTGVGCSRSGLLIGVVISVRAEERIDLILRPDMGGPDELHDRIESRHGLLKACGVEGFENIVADTVAHGRAYDLIVVGRGYHDDLNIGIELPKLC